MRELKNKCVKDTNVDFFFFFFYKIQNIFRNLFEFCDLKKGWKENWGFVGTIGE